MRAKPTPLHHSQRYGTNNILVTCFPVLTCKLSFSYAPFFLPLYHILILSFLPCLPPPLSSSLYLLILYSFRPWHRLFALFLLSLQGPGSDSDPGTWMRLPAQEMEQYKWWHPRPNPTGLLWLPLSLCVSVWKRRLLHRKRPPAANSPGLKVIVPSPWDCIHLGTWTLWFWLWWTFMSYFFYF